MTETWTAIDPATVPRDRVVMTRIDDGRGIRNEATLYAPRDVNLWFVPDGSMYVYYAPTHWRELTADERAKEAASLRRQEQRQRETTDRAIARLEIPDAK